MNKLILLSLACLFVLGATDPLPAFAAEDRASVRERIRERRAAPSDADLHRAGESLGPAIVVPRRCGNL